MKNKEKKQLILFAISIGFIFSGILCIVLTLLMTFSPGDEDGIYDDRNYIYRNELVNAGADTLINEKSAQIFEDALLKVNPDILETYLSWGGSFSLADIEAMNEDTGKTKANDINDDEYSGYSVMGYYKPSEVSIHLTWQYTKIEEVLYHELGHFIDHSIGTRLDDVYYVSQLDSWDKIYEAESVNSQFDRYHTDSKSEFFAQCYSLYMTDPEELYDKCPEVYQYIKNIDDNYALLVD